MNAQESTGKPTGKATGNSKNKSDHKVEIIDPPVKLIDKVGIGGPGAIDMAALERAERVITDLSDDYLNWVGKDLKNLLRAYEQMKVDGGLERASIQRVFEIAHDIKGQGGSFGFPLMTALGSNLCRLTEDRHRLSGKEMDVIALHVNAMSLVVVQKMKGDGGKDGRALVKGLELAVDKVQA